ncbi:MAG: LPS export ABC transporter ATP-binding protein [Gammaproteobacteria bacterium]|nr:MAG: LPS export ABC transporter ATP-binding protein [Gammaproteobacteria bacterium]
MSTLQVRNLSKSFRGRKVVRDVSLEVGSGEVIGLLGPNGAGKTTSFYMIIGLIPSDQGTILLDDGVISNLPIDRRARLGLGYLPQEASIFRRLTVAENILAILQTRPELSEAEVLERLENLLREFNIEHIRTQPGMSLSGGERRRVEIARALATDPKFLLLDEPFAGIDPISIHDLQQTIRYLANRGLGVLVTDHNVRETLGACHRSYIVNEGQIIAEGSQEDILSHDEVRSVYLGERFKL